MRLTTSTPTSSVATADRRRRWLGALLFGVLGFGLNLLAPVALIPGTELLFGGVAYLMAATVLGVGPGALAALITSSWTFRLWNQPYACAIFVVEAAAVGLLVRRWDRRVLTASATFWAFLGLPLIWLAYWGLLGIRGSTLAILVAKLTFNGLVNALLAEALLLVPAVRRLLRLRTAPRLRTTLATVISLAALLPALGLGIAQGRREWREAVAQIQGWVSQGARSYASTLQQHVRLHEQAVRTLADAPEFNGRWEPDRLQQLIMATRKEFPGFVSLYAANSRGVAVAFDPPQTAESRPSIGLDFSDRQYFRQLRGGDRTVISDVLHGRAGANQPLIAIAHPTTLGDTLTGFVAGALNLRELPRPPLLPDPQERLRVADRTGNLIFTSEAGFDPVMAVRSLSDSTAWAAVREVRDTATFIFVAEPARTAAAITAARTMAGAARIPSTGWVVWSEYPFRAIQNAVAESYARLLAVLAGVLLVSLLIGDMLASWLTAPLLRVREATMALASGTLSARVGKLPADTPEEVGDVGRSFDDMAVALGERTEELEELAALARQLASTLNTSELLGRIAAAAARLVEADGCSIALRQEDGLETVARAGPASADLDALLPPDGADVGPMSVRVSREGRDVAVPLRVGREALGMLLATRREQAFDAADLALLSAFADNAALALRNARLLEAAEAASRAKSDFIATMSHELRTPLNAILGHLDLLEMGLHGPVAPAQGKSLERIGAATRHLRGLIEEVLSFARLEAGRVELNLLPTDLCELGSEVGAVIEPLAREKGIALHIQNCRLSQLISTDPDKVRQIVINLAGNAVKFTAMGEVRIEVEERPDEVALVVADTGPGIALEDQERLFRPFEQLQSGFTRKHGGTGLGLYLSRRYAELLGGRIELRSAPGRGSTFWLILPRAAPGATAPVAGLTTDRESQVA